MQTFGSALFRFVVLSILIQVCTVASFSQGWDPNIPWVSSIDGSSTSPIVQWDPVQGAIRYIFQVSQDPGFDTLLLNDSSVVDTVRAFGPIVPDTGYYCRIATITSSGPSAWSDTIRFYAETDRNLISFFPATGWSLISLPLKISDAARNFIFPDPCRNPAAFCYTGSGYDCCAGIYQSLSSGFWLKWMKTAPIVVTGIPLTVDTEAIRKGWNLIGSVIGPVPTSSIVHDPAGSHLSNFFGYGGSGWTIVSTIRPFGGYWVRSDSVGRLILPLDNHPKGEIVAYVHWRDYPIAGKKLVLVETGDTVHTDSSGLASFVVPPGKYTVRAFDINRGGPALISVDFPVEAEPGIATTVNIVDCLPCF